VAPVKSTIEDTLPSKRKNQQWFDRLTILSEVEGTIFSFLSRPNLQFCRSLYEMDVAEQGKGKK